ncbi:MAG: hypothetical protein EP330_11270 [Deltaproteobacteria bacterium]|nr:MAG: hypothetical protein EP330_11270 [Deltaproteobacteria bacterium]
MSSFRRLALGVALMLGVGFSLACGSGGDEDEDHTPTVEDTQYLDWDLTAQWASPTSTNPFSAGVLTADGQRLLLSYGAQGGRGLSVLDVSRHGELLLYATFEELDIQLFRAVVDGGDLWTFIDGHLKLWDISAVDLSGAVLVQEHPDLIGIFDIALTDDTLFVGTFDGLYVFDRGAAESGALTFDDAVGFVPTIGAINDYTVTAQGTDSVWLGGFEGKALIDVSDRTAPTFVRSLGDRNEIDVLLVGELLVSHGRTWDVSDPANPEFVTFLPFTYGEQTLLDERTVVSSSEGLVWTDFSQSPPVEVRRIETTGQFQPLSNGEAVFGVDDFLVYRVEAP